MKTTILTFLLLAGTLVNAAQSKVSCSLSTSVDNEFNAQTKSIESDRWETVEGSIGQKKLSIIEKLLNERIEVIVLAHKISLQYNLLTVLVSDKKTGVKSEASSAAGALSFGLNIPDEVNEANKIDIQCSLTE